MAKRLQITYVIAPAACNWPHMIGYQLAPQTFELYFPKAASKAAVSVIL